MRGPLLPSSKEKALCALLLEAVTNMGAWEYDDLRNWRQRAESALNSPDEPSSAPSAAGQHVSEPSNEGLGLATVGAVRFEPALTFDGKAAFMREVPDGRYVLREDPTSPTDRPDGR